MDGVRRHYVALSVVIRLAVVLVLVAAITTVPYLQNSAHKPAIALIALGLGLVAAFLFPHPSRRGAFIALGKGRFSRRD